MSARRRYKRRMDVLDAQFVAGATDVSQLPAPTFAEVAFAGRSNVGKSSLINSLVGRRNLVRTSSAPGCTRAINIFRVHLRTDAGDAHLDLVDLPGYGYAKRSKAERRSWGPLIERFLSERPGLCGVVVILDVRREAQQSDAQLLEFLDSVGVPAIIVATKTDKLRTSQRKLAVAALRERLRSPVVSYSSSTGEGREALWRRLLSVSHIEGVDRGTAP